MFTVFDLGIETSILTTDKVVGNLQPSDHMIRLTALTQWSIQTRLGTEDFQKKLSLNRKAEALSRQQSNLQELSLPPDLFRALEK